MSSPNEDIIEKVHRLLLMLVKCARGGKDPDDNKEYQTIRGELVPVFEVKLPRIARVHRTLPEFWRFIKPKFKSWSERESFITGEFTSLLNELEGFSDESPEVESAVESQNDSDVVANDSNKKKTVFVVYGRNSAARIELFAFLRALHLHPLESGQVRKLTGKGSPYVGEILAAGFKAAQAAVVLFTPDDESRLREPYLQQSDGDDERQLSGQPRQKVLFEAGMAMGLDEDRTIIVELGKLRPMSDVVGRHVIRLNDSLASRNELAERLQDAGCDVDRAGADWLSTGKFSDVLTAIASIFQAAANLPPESVHDDSGLARSLSDDERAYLMDIRRPTNVHGLAIEYMRSSGYDIRHLEMMEHFCEIGLARKLRDVFLLTTKGQRVADFLWRSRILSALLDCSGSVASPYNLAQTVELTDGELEVKELDRHFEVLKGERKTNMVKGSVQITDLGRAAVKGRV